MAAILKISKTYKSSQKIVVTSLKVWLRSVESFSMNLSHKLTAEYGRKIIIIIIKIIKAYVGGNILSPLPYRSTIVLS